MAQRTLAPVPRAWTERLAGAPESLAEGPRGYWPRQRIRDRLLVLTDTLIADEDPDEIVLLSHSQGTMIALDALELVGRRWRSRSGGGTRRIVLVTMGSPRRHLYGHYFPAAWPPPATRPRLAPGGVLDAWVNIWRTDDFVGTRIAEPDAPAPLWPDEQPVAPRGHTDYWLDPQVFARLTQALRFDGA